MGGWMLTFTWTCSVSMLLAGLALVDTLSAWRPLEEGTTHDPDLRIYLNKEVPESQLICNKVDTYPN